MEHTLAQCTWSGYCAASGSGHAQTLPASRCAEALHLPLNNHCDDRCCRCCIQAASKFSVGGVLDLCATASSMLT